MKTTWVAGAAALSSVVIASSAMAQAAGSQSMFQATTLTLSADGHTKIMPD